MEAGSGRPVKRLLIVVAMMHEAASIIKALALTPLDASTPNRKLSPPMLGFHAPLEGDAEVFLVVNGSRVVHEPTGEPRRSESGEPVTVEGVSLVAAAVSAWDGLAAFEPDIVLSVGTAGGVKALGAVKGQVYVCEGPVRYFDRHIDFRLPTDRFEPNNYWCYGMGNYPSADISAIRERLSLPIGRVASGASFYPMFGKSKEVFDEYKCNLVEMEAAALAEVCYLKKVPFVAIKGVTDFIDHHDDVGDISAQFNQELVPVSEKVAEVAAKVVKELVNYKI